MDIQQIKREATRLGFQVRPRSRKKLTGAQRDRRDAQPTSPPPRYEGPALTRDELVANVAAGAREPVGIVEQIVALTLAEIRTAVTAGKRVQLPDFGDFTDRGGQAGFRTAHPWQRELSAREGVDRG